MRAFDQPFLHLNVGHVQQRLPGRAMVNHGVGEFVLRDEDRVRGGKDYLMRG